MKPVALVERAIRNSSQRGDLVLDCFGGAGSTLIASEKSGGPFELRRCPEQKGTIRKQFGGHQIRRGSERMEAADVLSLVAASSPPPDQRLILQITARSFSVTHARDRRGRRRGRS